MTPVLVWTSSDGKPQSVVETDQEYGWTSEEFRGQAEALDRRLDEVLDQALKHVRRFQAHSANADFLRAWAIGKSLNDSKVVESESMKNERPERLWKALSSKCRLGLNSSGDARPDWRALRPGGSRIPRREGGRLDYFEMCRWLAEQDYKDAQQVFGGSIRNVWQMLERPTLRPLVVRKALLLWLNKLSSSQIDELHDRTPFAEMMKRLRERWPDRGPGSAKRPTHYREDQLQEELSFLLEPLVTGPEGRRN